MELKDELKQHEADAELLRKMAKRAQMEIYRVKAEIQAEKPKLRHGDYGFDDIGNARICIHDGIDSEASRRLWPTRVFGNIFDDLKALQEDVTGFEVGEGEYHIKASWSNMGSIELDQGDPDPVLVEDGDIDEFIRKIQQMWATQQRKAL